MYPKGPIRLMFLLYKRIFPIVRLELGKWRNRAEQIPDPELRKQALASIENKTFHCEGGSVYASAVNQELQKSLISLIVAYQTISDYLDNLCDRSTSNQMENFIQLHQAMLDAVSLRPPHNDYYRFNTEKADGGYLLDLVLTCQKEISNLPNYAIVKDEIYMLSQLYCDLQAYKHISPEVRESKLYHWWELYKGKTPQLTWYEFAAATGSTLGIFHLFEVACFSHVKEQRVNDIMKAYFPWIGCLHILLDYLIDLEEDFLGGDLNFVTYYQNPSEIYQRLSFITKQARQYASSLPDSAFHLMIIDGLLGLYLSDGKVIQQPMVSKIAKQLINGASLRTRFFFWNSRGYRGKKVVLQAPPD